MAILKFGVAIVGIRGTIGGLLCSANRSGPYGRVWTKPTDPQTYAQLTGRWNAAIHPEAWRALSDPERTAWNDYGAASPQINALGETYYLSGWQWFVKCNQRLLETDRPTVTAPPTNPAPDTVVCNALDYDNSDFPFRAAIEFDEEAFGANTAVIFARVLPCSGNTTMTSNFALVRATNSPGPGVTELSFAFAHALKWGYPLLDWKCFVRVFTQSDEGLRSVPWTASQVYTEP